MRKLRLAILLIISCALLSDLAAQETLNSIVKRGELRVGMSGNQPPFNMTSKAGTIMGFEKDLADLLAESMNVELKVVQMPFAELIPALEKGDIDMVMSGMNVTPERNLRVIFAGPYAITGKSIVTNSAALAKIDESSDADNPNYKIAALRGSTSETFVKKWMPRTTLVSVANYEEGAQKVISDEVDAMVADYTTCVVSVLKYPEAELLTLETPLTIEPVSIAIAPNDPLFLNLLNNYIASIELSGALELLEAMWFENGDWMLEMK